MIKISGKYKNIDNPFIRIAGILFIGIIMPVIFYTESDSSGLVKWIIISTSLTFISWETSRCIITILWKRYPWEKSPMLHLLLNILFLTILTIVLSLIVYFINWLFDDVSGNYREKMRGVHVAILLITFLTTSIYEGIFLFFKWKESLVLTVLLEKENIRSQFETLKNQVNPHFLFNSLNTLSQLIPENPEKAVEFVNKFSSIYRYVLDVRELNSVELRDELDFVKSYIYLQRIRYGENLQVAINIDANKLNSHIMPLSLQVLIENAIKHNEISDKYPLRIELTDTNDFLIVKNNLKLFSDTTDSPKMGLKNLTERYRLVSNKKPYFEQNENEFIAGIPFSDDIL